MVDDLMTSILMRGGRPLVQTRHNSLN